ncbi:MAG TPA: 1-deoxy-D-xylulose-5-phosphate synthase [Candidatus Dormibacteraeota bacterium]|nr:1-deoxy-D-xylulose-5-phosphate synthase [Candidatus Dormibacteraeota bacterium]
MILDRIDSPSDLKRLSREELRALAGELRERIVEVCAQNGGHLAPNLGVVELTLALHYVLDSPHDKIVWDVSHQCYAHKLITGRRDRFDTLRQGGGLSGFAMRSESPHDAFGAGHASTAVSAALGMATARDLRGGGETVAAVLGDGALTGGLAYEALNNAGQRKSNFIVVLNDNEMSIAPNVGSIASYLSVLRARPLYRLARNTTKFVLGHVPFGGAAKRALGTAEQAAMRMIAPDEKTAIIFEELGFTYVGPMDGHDFDHLVAALEAAKGIAGPVLIHVLTRKGKGYQPAELDSRTFHGCGAFEVENGKIERKPDARPTFSDAFGDAIVAAAEHDPRVVGITAAMPDGTKLSKLAKALPERYVDVGIAEAHAVCFAAGLASQGMKPVCAIYSTFLQRAYDQVIHDVVIQGLPVVFAIDRAGLVGDDGPTHMGLYDLAFLRTLPGITIMAPRDESELPLMLDHALSLERPAALRYPRGSTSGRHVIPPDPVVQGRAEVLRPGRGVALLALGNCVEAALDAADLLVPEGIAPTVVNARFVAPLDGELLTKLAADHPRWITVEEASLAGGFGSAVLEFVADRGLEVTVERVGVPPVLVQHHTQRVQRAAFGMAPEPLAQRVRSALRGVEGRATV